MLLAYIYEEIKYDSGKFKSENEEEKQDEHHRQSEGESDRVEKDMDIHDIDRHSESGGI